MATDFRMVEDFIINPCAKTAARLIGGFQCDGVCSLCSADRGDGERVWCALNVAMHDSIIQDGGCRIIMLPITNHLHEWPGHHGPLEYNVYLMYRGTHIKCEDIISGKFQIEDAFNLAEFYRLCLELYTEIQERTINNAE